MTRSARAGWRHWLARVRPRDRSELGLLVGAIVFLVVVVSISKLASEVF